MLSRLAREKCHLHDTSALVDIARSENLGQRMRKQQPRLADRSMDRVGCDTTISLRFDFFLESALRRPANAARR